MVSVEFSEVSNFAYVECLALLGEQVYFILLREKLNNVVN